MITAEGYERFFGNDNEVLGFPFFLWSVSIGSGGSLFRGSGKNLLEKPPRPLPGNTPMFF